MKPYLYTLLAAAAATGLAQAQTAYTTPVGYVSHTCLNNSDTILSLPLRQSPSFVGSVSGVPDTTTAAGFAVLALGSTPGLTADAFANTHYLKFTSGADAGNWFVITANTADAITVDLNGASLAAGDTDSFEVIKLWTLGEVFVPVDSTTDPTTTGNAIVASTNALPTGRRTEVLLPDLTTAGINLAASSTYYILNGAWRKVGQPATTSFDSTQLWPDNYIVVRHPAAVTAPTTYTATGEVETGSFMIPLTTQDTAKQDNFIGLPRPVDVALNDLALGGTSAFLSSTNALPTGRRDELLVFDNNVAARNKAASATYYYLNSAWRKVGQPATTDFGADVIKAGSGFIIRKYQVSGGPTALWNNTSSY